MRLYQFALSPNCQKVVALAKEVGLPLELVNLDVFKGATKTPEFLAKNPNGKIPVLEDDGLVLWESNAILGYVAAKADRTDLAPTAPRERADVDRWLNWQAAHFSQAVGKVTFERIVKKLAGWGPPDDAVIAKGTEEFARYAKVLDESLVAKDFLCGRLTIADFSIATYAANTENCGLDFGPYPNARKWLGRMLARESIRTTLASARGAH
jgi:glutathione S-transferase